MAAGYTAFLFKQCKGRDLWEAPGLFWHLIAQSVTAGAAFFLLFGIAVKVVAVALLLGALTLVVLHALPMNGKGHTDNYIQAKGFIRTFAVAHSAAWFIALWAAFAARSLLMRALEPSFVPALAVVGALILVHLFLYERAFVRAGQLPPLS